MVTRFRLARSLFALTILVAACAARHAASAAPLRLPACGPLPAHFSTGALPHQAFTLPTDRANQWHPIATDGPHVLMGWEYSREPVFGGPVHLSIITLPSTRLVPVPTSAYPRRTFLGGWQLDWPWIAGIAYTTPLPAFPANWQLWAGNVVTGQHMVLDSYRAHRQPVSEFYPHFALDAGRVVWEYSTNERGPIGDPLQRIAMEDLSTGQRTFLTAPRPNAVDERITFSGTRIVWESVETVIGSPHAVENLWLYDLRSHTLSRLSRNLKRGASMYPRVLGRYLLFEQAPFVTDGGTPYLVDLTTRQGGVSGSEWWRAYRFRQLDRSGLDNTQMGTGLVSWANWNVLDVTRSRKWPTWYWRVDAIAGRTVLVDHLDPNNGHETYVAWRVSEVCTPTGFR